MDKLRVFESFSGVGSQRMALRNIGCNFEVVGISEVDKSALLAYDAIHENQDEEVEIKSKEDMLAEMREANIAYNFSTGKDEMPRGESDIRKLYAAHKRSKNYGDITKINTDTLPDFDFFTYSFPCKNISIAGKQDGLERDSGTQSSLVWECERIIRAKKPKYLMMENVKNICGKSNMGTFQEWIDLLSKMGYSSLWKILDGKNYGVAQRRERVIMISILGDGNINISETNNKKKTIRDTIDTDVDKKYFLTYPWHYIKDGEKKDNKNTIANIDTISYSKSRSVLSIDGLCATLDAMGGGQREPKILDVCGRLRKLTPLECWRLMGFSDDDYHKAESIGGLSNSKLYERAGRGIVVPMLEEQFKIIFKQYILKEQ